MAQHDVTKSHFD